MSHDHKHHEHKHGHDHHSHDHHDHCHDHAHDHGHSHEHSHTHGHDHQDQAPPMSMEDKLTLLFSHWIDHNDSHKDNFSSWAAKAREAGLEKVADALDEAGILSDKVTQQLRAAQGLLKS